MEIVDAVRAVSIPPTMRSSFGMPSRRRYRSILPGTEWLEEVSPNEPYTGKDALGNKIPVSAVGKIDG